MKLIASILIVSMTLSTSAWAGNATHLYTGETVPYEGVLIDHETALILVERANAYDAAYAALLKQNDMLIEVQKEKIALEFERERAIRNSQKKDTAIVIIMMIAAALVAGK